MNREFCTPEGLNEISSAFFGSLKEVVYTTTGFDIQQIAPHDSYADIAAILNFAGENSGFLLIDADVETLRLLSSYMTGCDAEEISEADMSDCLCEIANMTGGSAKAALAGNGFLFSLTMPFTITGENKRIIFKTHTTVLHTAFSDGQISMGIRVVLY